MKKILYSIILIISVCLLGIFFLNNNTYAAVKVNNKLDGGHEHNYSKLIIHINPSCTMNGVNIYKCTNCIFIKSQVIDKTGHNYTKVSETKATCTKEGREEYKCTNCNKTTSKKIDVLEHDYKLTNQKAPTCSENGYKTYKCKLCNKIMSKTIYKSGHNYKTVIIEPTCTKAGKKVEICTKCNQAKEGSTVRTEALGHNFVYDKTKQPDSSTHVMKCTRKGCTEIGFEKHTMSKATCKSSAKCKICNWTDGKLLEHNYSWETTPATCEKEGYRIGICSICKNQKKEIIKVKNHEMIKEYEQNLQDPLTHYEVNKCTRCDYISNEIKNHEFDATTNKCICGTLEEKPTQEETSVDYETVLPEPDPEPENKEEVLPEPDPEPDNKVEELPSEEEIGNLTDTNIHKHTPSKEVKYLENTNDVSTHYVVFKCIECGEEIYEPKKHEFYSNKCACGQKLTSKRSIQINRSKAEGFEGEIVNLSIGIVGDSEGITITKVEWSADNKATIQKNGNTSKVTLPMLATNKDKATVKISAKIYLKIDNTTTSLVRTTNINVYKAEISGNLISNNKTFSLPLGTSTDVGVNGLKIISGTSIKIEGTTIIAISVGETKIKDAIGNEYTVIVTEEIIPIKKIKVETLNISKGQTKQLKISVEPENATMDFLINSSNTNVLVANNTGEVKAIKEGNVTITIKSKMNKNISTQITLKVTKLPTERVDRMNFATIEGEGDNAYLLIGGNSEMDNLDNTIEKYSPVINKAEGDVIVATTTVKKDGNRDGVKWVTGHKNNVSNTVKQIQENNVNTVEAYSSGSMLAVAAVDEAIQNGDNTVEELILYDGFLGMDVQPDAFNRIVNNGIKVTIYYTDEGEEPYPNVDLTKWEDKEKYPNVTIVELPRESNHGTVIRDAQKMN